MQTPEVKLRRRLTEVRSDLFFWANALHNRTMAKIRSTRRILRIINKLHKEELQILRALNEFDPAITYLAPAISRSVDTGSWKRKRFTIRKKGNQK